MKQLRNIILAVSALTAGHAMAQQEVMVSQYMFNGLFLNPAYAGSHGYTSSSMLHRTQWLQMEGAPRTSMAAVDGSVMNGKMGLGLSIVHDQIGVSRDLDVAGHYSYHLQMGENSKLALGLRAGLSVYSARLSELTIWDTNDQVFQNNINNQTVGKFGFGLYWYNATSYVGLSVPTIHATDKNIRTDIAGIRDKYYTQHYYLHAGKVFPLNEVFDIKPSTMIKYMPNAPIEADINCNLLYRERIWFGVGYRTGDAFIGMLEYQVNPQMRIGYAYDMTTSRLRNYSSGSHEVMLGIDFGRELVKIKTPRYF
jgi:type IX secretion system PorP/SprF family membrane protein